MAMCFLVLNAPLFWHCSSRSSEAIIIGKWQIVDLDVGRTLTDSERTRLDSSFIEFRGDSTFEVNRAGATRTGVWQFNANKTALFIDDGVNEQKLNIESLSEDTLIVSEIVTGKQRKMTLTSK